MKENLFIKIILIVLGMMLINSTLQNCELKREQQKFRNLQIAYSDTLKAQIERIAARRIDTLAVINNYQDTIIKEVEKKKDEISNTTDIDSLIRLYYRYRPVVKADK